MLFRSTNGSPGHLRCLGRLPQWRGKTPNRYSVMRICRTALLPTTLVLFCLAACAQGQSHAAAKVSSEIQRARLSHLEGMIVDMGTGDIKYALVSAGGVLGVRSTRKIAPVQALSDATAKAGILALDVSTRRWKKAPQFRRSELKRLGQPQRAAEISAFYSRAAQGAPRIPAAPNGRHPTPSTTGREDQRHRQPNYELASDIMGRDVINQQNKVVGQISDLLIDLVGAKRTFAIISRARLLQRGKSYAVPLCQVSQSPDHRLKIETNGAALTQAQPFTERTWETTAAA